MFSSFRSRIYRKLKKPAKSKSFCGRFPKMGRIPNGKKIIDMGEFREDWDKGPGGWNIDANILEEQVGDCHEMENRELGVQHVNNNDIADSHLENLQYKLPQENGKYDRGRSREIIEQ